MASPWQPNRWRFACACTLLITVRLALRLPVSQGATVSLTMKPHCILPEPANCPSYQALDPDTLTTPTLHTGDILDIDVVLDPQGVSQIALVRSWLQYDPRMLEARSVELSSAMSEPIPGEREIDSTNGLIKIGGGMKTVPDQPFSLVRITFRVLSPTNAPVLRFYGYKPDGKGETTVAGSENGKLVPLLSVQPSALKVAYAGPSVASSQTSEAPPGAVTEPGSSAFALLQVQNVRVTTKDADIFIGWDPLHSSELAGYNVYYGTISGKYIQRRSVPASSSSLILRELDSGTQYFLAVRAFNAASGENTFSQEVAVVVGRPETSTSPLAGNAPDAQPVNPIESHGGTEVKGATGTGDTLLVLVLASAFIGTFFAVQRQLKLRPLTHA